MSTCASSRDTFASLRLCVIIPSRQPSPSTPTVPSRWGEEQGVAGGGAELDVEHLTDEIKEQMKTYEVRGAKESWQLPNRIEP